MYRDSVDRLRCPRCQAELQLAVDSELGEEVVEGTLRCTGCGDVYPIADGLPRLVFPPVLDGLDKSSQAFYDDPSGYDYRLTAFRFGIWGITFGNPVRLWQQWPVRLELQEGDTVLETGIGYGSSVPFLGKSIGRSGRLDGLDISSVSLRAARGAAKHQGVRCELVQGNASYLPYRDGLFDGVLHMGGFNGFEDKQRAVNEMHRVAKVGGKVVVMDEGLAPGREKTLLGKYIMRCMPLFASKPPLALLPDGVAELKAYWIYQGTFWVIEYRKAK